jgi:hypothetical protein
MMEPDLQLLLRGPSVRHVGGTAAGAVGGAAVAHMGLVLKILM